LGLLDLLQDGAGSFGGVVGAGNGAADYEQGSSLSDGLCRSGYAFLIVS
jgi:hypothetical protein